MIITGTAIVAAITAGLTQGATAVVRDDAKALTSKIRAKFGGKPEVAKAIEAYDPTDEDSHEFLAKKLDKAGVGDDPEIVEAVRELAAKLGPSFGPVTAFGQGAVAVGQVTGGNVTGTVNHNYAPPVTQEHPVRWRISHAGGMDYTLENVGVGTAYDVSITPHESAGRFTPPRYADPTWWVGEPRVFEYSTHWGSTNEVTVRYRLNKGGELHTRVLPLPKTA